MKKIINGKLYDTQTAQEIHSYYSGVGNDFSKFEETLYLKKNGEYFLYCSGGPLSIYAEQYGNSWGSGDKFSPLNYKEAKKWAEGHMDVDGFSKIFGMPEE